MRRAGWWFVAVVAVLVTASWLHSATSVAPPTGRVDEVSVPGPLGHHRVAIDTHAFADGNAGAAEEITAAARRNAFVVLQCWREETARALKAANPDLTILMYKNVGFMREGAGPGGCYSSGIGYEQAEPEYFLRNTDGKRFASDSYANHWTADVGLPAYQDELLARLLADLEARPWFDGVLMDEVTATLEHHYEPSEIRKYPDDESYQDAARSMVARVAPELRAEGHLVIPNMGGTWAEHADFYDSLLPYVDGGFDEFFTTWAGSDGHTFHSERLWDEAQESIRHAQAAGKYYLATTPLPTGDLDDPLTRRIARYGYASALLAGGDRTTFALAHDYTEAMWLPEFDRDLGAPTGPATEDDNGVWRREFAAGLVVVNPTDATHSVSFGGRYSGSGLAEAPGTDLRPHTGLVLQRAD